MWKRACRDRCRRSAEGLLPYDRAHKLAERFYTEAEKKHLLSFTSETAYAAEVTRLWTVKEAISKQIGTGNPISYDGLCIPEGLKLHSHTYKAPDGSSVCISLCTPSDAEEPITVCRDNM